MNMTLDVAANKMETIMNQRIRISKNYKTVFTEKRISGLICVDTLGRLMLFSAEFNDDFM